MRRPALRLLQRESKTFVPEGATCFSLLVQRKAGKRKHTPVGTPALRAGPLRSAEFSEAASPYQVRGRLCGSENGAHPCAPPPAGFVPPRLPALNGVKGEARARAKVASSHGTSFSCFSLLQCLAAMGRSYRWVDLAFAFAFLFLIFGSP